MTSEGRKCRNCGVVLTEENGSRSGVDRNGKSRICKPCHNAYYYGRPITAPCKDCGAPRSPNDVPGKALCRPCYNARCKVANAKWRLKNMDKLVAAVSEWNSRHPEKIREYRKNEYAKRKAARNDIVLNILKDINNDPGIS